MPDKVEYKSEAGKALVEMFKEYAQLNSRDLPVLIRKTGGELAANCYIETPRADKTEIQNKMESLGARFIRAPRAFALKVGPKMKQKTFAAVASKVEKKARRARGKAKKLNKIKGKLLSGASLPDVGPQKFKIGKGKKARFATGLRDGLTLTEEKFAATVLRMGRRGAAKSSWIPAMRKLGSTMKAARGDEKRANERPETSVQLVSSQDEKFTVIITNTQGGITKLNNQSLFLDKAVKRTTANLKVYNDRKKGEIAAKMKAAAAKTKK